MSGVAGRHPATTQEVHLLAARSLRRSSPLAALVAATALLGSANVATAHDARHAFAIGSEGIDWIFDVAADEDGNGYIAGSFGQFGSATDFDPSPAQELRTPKAQDGDTFVAKYTADGGLDWVVTVPADGIARGVAVEDDWVYVAGWFGGTRDFDPGPGQMKLTAVGYRDAYVMRLRKSDGRFSWAVRFGGTRHDCPDLSIEWLEALAVASGRVYVGGMIEGPADFDPGPGTVRHTPSDRCDGARDGYVLALDASDGSFDFVSTFTGPDSNSILDMETDEHGDLVVAGGFSGWVDFDPGPGVVRRHGSRNGSGFLLKLTATGGFDWVRKVPTYTAGVAAGPGGSVYGAGFFTGTGDFDGGAGEELRTAANADGYVVAYTATGAFRWVATAPSTDTSAGDAIAVDGHGRVVVAGNLGGTADFDPGPGVAERSTRRGGRFSSRLDPYAWVLSGDGEFVAAHRLGGRGWQDARAVATAGTDILLTGVVVDTGDFDPGAGRLLVDSHGSIDGYFARLSE
jgi:hypothetical protein